jgi:hypothetical protein
MSTCVTLMLAWAARSTYKITTAPERRCRHPRDQERGRHPVYHRNWIDDGEGNIEAPEHIEMQIQHQMEVADIDWCCLVALVGGNTQKVHLPRKRDREIGGNIRAKVVNVLGRWSMQTLPQP